MFIRSLLITVVLVMPIAASAEELTPEPQPENAPQEVDPTIYQSAAPGTDGQGTPSSLLGPQSGASLTTDGASLQPAGSSSSPLQSTTNDSTGLTAPSGSQLQGAAPTDAQLQVLNNEVDGERQPSGGSESSNENSFEAGALDTLAIGLLLGLMALIVILRQRTVRRFGN